MRFCYTPFKMNSDSFYVNSQIILISENGIIIHVTMCE